MTATALASFELALLVGGALGARRFTRWLSRDSDNKRVLLLASVAAWLVLFGMVPFLFFASFVQRVPDANIGPFATVVLNFIPFALVTSPLIGFGQGLTARRRSKSRRSAAVEESKA